MVQHGGFWDWDWGLDWYVEIQDSRRLATGARRLTTVDCRLATGDWLALLPFRLDSLNLFLHKTLSGLRNDLGDRFANDAVREALEDA
jgi:hypothetical protein